MHIEKHISELLFEHDCVIIPGFGGFVCNYSSAGINTSLHRFHPPSKKISFNRNLKNNDGLLANQIAQAAGVSYSDSNRFIAEYVEKMNKEIRADKRFSLKNIGIFYLGEEDTLHFEQDQTVNYLPESFGLNTFYSPAIKREPVERKIEKRLKDKMIVPSKEQTNAIPVTRRTARYVTAAAAILAVSLLIWVPLQTGLLKNMDYSTLNPFAPRPQPEYHASEIRLPGSDLSADPKDINNLLSPANDTLQYLNMVIGEQVPIVVQMKDDAPVAVKSMRKERKSERNLHIVGGAFAVPQNAEKFCKKLIAMGYDATIVNRKGKALRFVSYGRFSTRKEALQAMDKIKGVQSDVWLMTN